MSLHARILAAAEPWLTAPLWVVAFSGGLDSTVLLHLLASLRRSRQLPPIIAVHVHHGLQDVADDWPAHCGKVCEQLGVTLELLCVQVDETGPSLEGKAREARYRALGDQIPTGGVLFTGQHLDDQAETLLFRLFRGAGVNGLAGMPADRQLGAGRLVRPLLGCGRDELEEYARAQHLCWIEDPSNASLVHSRNFLRHQVMPVIRQRWPRASESIARAALHCREAQLLLDELAELDLKEACTRPRHDWLTLPSLDLERVGSLSPPRQRNVLRYWLRGFTELPDSDHWAGWQTLRDAASDASPVWRLGAGELHRGDGRLWWLSGPWLEQPPAAAATLIHGQDVRLSGNGALRIQGRVDSGVLAVRYRVGGEALRLPERGRRDLKRLLNEAGVPGFVRSRLPLLYRDDELVAVANLPQFDVSGLSLVWSPPQIPGLS
jgi:tRNA(Ile)-lysidine synthase